MVAVRAALRSDTPAMGRVHVRAWQHAYRGLMPDDYLDALAPADRAAHWARVLASPGDGVVLVAERDDAVAGFAAAGPAREPVAAGELYALNVDPDHWGTGVGPALVAAAQDALAGQGFAEAVLWVLAGNTRARRFYARQGWHERAGVARTVEVFGIGVHEVGYHRALPAAGVLAHDPG